MSQSAATAQAYTAGPAYRREQVLVSTDWVATHGSDPGVRVVEVDVDTSAYDAGHIDGAIGWNWTTQLCDRHVRDVIQQPELERLLGASGIDRDTTIVLYGDNNNWFAAWAFWQLKLYDHRDVRIMDGGRKKWVAEGRRLVQHVPAPQRVIYAADDPNYSTRAFRPDVLALLGEPRVELVDVRSPQEFSGEVLAPPGLAETCQRGGHIPGAVNIPWSKACNEDGTFKSEQELRALYEGVGVTPDKAVITYCRIGERSAHSWFVLTCLLSYPNVRNYDGSWTEWGNLVAAPIATGS